MKFYNRDWFNTVYHYFIREEYLGEGRGGLMNFLPLKRESLLEGAGLFKRGGGGGGLREDLWYMLFAVFIFL